MPQATHTTARCCGGLSHGLLYCVASLVLGIELNIVGPTVNSLATQVGVAEAALGGVVGLGGIGLLVGGIPAGWLLDKLPGHTVLAGALALQATTFLLLPHCAHLAVLAATYCAAALTFNAITTGANALILWRYPASQGAWLNLASALFGVGCFLAPVLADLATMGAAESQRPHQAPHNGDGVGPGSTEGGGGGGGGPFAVRGGPAAAAYYAVSAGAAACALWAISLPSPPRPQQHHHHHNHEQQAGGPAVVQDDDSRTQMSLSAQRAKPKRAGPGSGGSDGPGGSSPGDLSSSLSFASVLDLNGLESPPTSVGSQPPRTFDGGGEADGNFGAPIGPATTSTPASAADGGATWGSSSTASSTDAAAGAGAPPQAAVVTGAADAAAMRGAPAPAAASLPPTGNGGAASSGSGETGSNSGTDGGFGSALSTSPPTSDEAGSGAADQTCRHPDGADDGTGDSSPEFENPVHGAATAAAAAPHDSSSDILSAAAEQVKRLQQQQRKFQQQQHEKQGAGMALVAAPPRLWRRGGASASTAAAMAVSGPHDMEALPGGQGGHPSSCHAAEGGAGAVSQHRAAAHGKGSAPLSPTAALFRRYVHELRMGWPVLLPVVLLLFANISTQASFGAWVTTYCERAAGLDEASAHAVTAAYWAAFTGTRMAAVAAAPFLHASWVLLITSPFAVAGAGMAVAGIPKIPWLAPGDAADASTAAAAAAAFGAGLPSWALYTAVCLVGVGVSTGFANAVSLTGDHLQLDGFTNGILSSVAGLASTLCPAAVPWLAEHTRMGYGALMAVALAMSGVQLAMVLGALLGARWVDEWRRTEEEEEDEEEEAVPEQGEGVTVMVMTTEEEDVEELEGGGRCAAGGQRGAASGSEELTTPLLPRRPTGR